MHTLGVFLAKTSLPFLLPVKNAPCSWCMSELGRGRWWALLPGSQGEQAAHPKSLPLGHKEWSIVVSRSALLWAFLSFPLSP